MDEKMFCRQCEQTAMGKACTISGVCGKSPETAELMENLILGLQGIAIYGKKLREKGIVFSDVDRFISEALFITITNVDFDPGRLGMFIEGAHNNLEKLKKEFKNVYPDYDISKLPQPAHWKKSDIKIRARAGILENQKTNQDIRSLKETLLYGMKGMAAYADHAWILGHKDEEVNSFFYKGLSAIADEDISSEDLVGMVLECGKVNLKCMEMLDRAHTNRFGNPVPTKVFLGTKKGPAIVVSGHDLFDLEQLLEQTEDTGINIYTHGEMLPAHGYPELKKYRHLVGHYGTAWQNQQREFDSFPGPILMTTNCIQKPRPSYIERIFTTGLVGWPGVKHIAGTNSSKDFTPIIEAAKKVGGFPEDKPGKEITVGFAHNAVLSIADRIVDAVKKGHIKRIFLVGGCDGAKPGRNYYTQFAQTIPDDCLILTLACGKFRFNNLDFGEINSIPRLIDCGQCNDAYSAIIIAKALADAFGCSVNELPLSLILSWYEQKAVCILLTLFSLGIKNIRLGPTLPAFLSENVLKILIENFNVKPITTVEADLKEILGN
ncbi:MAG: Hydroxylamine reductase [candidate division TA06 bacterium ADurb.Bin131]|uniref:Hydroxylamine reductase n=1 Tax=candidate division TA06 bacterium ADurb.Bin131 TaxID=1852827 RepID=A0A1V6C9U0_UNCT6|nr:MAG: Hydroxylamine reductase [candidate division TA06 bacterium ADurb.Bin131]